MVALYLMGLTLNLQKSFSTLFSGGLSSKMNLHASSDHDIDFWGEEIRKVDETVTPNNTTTKVLLQDFFNSHCKRRHYMFSVWMPVAHCVSLLVYLKMFFSHYITYQTPSQMEIATNISLHSMVLKHLSSTDLQARIILGPSLIACHFLLVLNMPRMWEMF